MEPGEHNSIGALLDLTAGWKGTLKRYGDAVGLLPGSPLDVVAARAAESDRRVIYVELQKEISRLRAQNPNDPGLRAASEQFQTCRSFLLFAEAERITPHLDAVIQRFTRESEHQTLQKDAKPEDPPGIQPSVPPNAAQELGRIRAEDLQTIQSNWLQEGWPSRLRYARASRAMAQKEAAHEFGVADETYERWERGKQRPAFRYLTLVLKFIRAGALKE